MWADGEPIDPSPNACGSTPNSLTHFRSIFSKVRIPRRLPNGAGCADCAPARVSETSLVPVDALFCRPHDENASAATGILDLDLIFFVEPENLLSERGFRTHQSVHWVVPIAA